LKWNGDFGKSSNLPKTGGGFKKQSFPLTIDVVECVFDMQTLGVIDGAMPCIIIIVGG